MKDDLGALAALSENRHLCGSEGPSKLDYDDLGTTQPLHRATARPRWEIRYARAVAVADLTAMAVSFVLHHYWGQGPAVHDVRVALGLTLMVLTAAALRLTHAWDPLMLGRGSQEFSRLLRALVMLAVVIGLAGLAMKLPEVRPYAFGVVPMAFILAAAGRLALRKVLHRRRRNGACMHDVLAVGTADSVANLIVHTQRAPHHGWKVTGSCTPSGTGTNGGPMILDVPVVGDLDSVAKVAGDGKYQVVSVAQTPGWNSQRLHHLAWDLECTGAELVVDPGLMEIAGPRLHVAAVDGLPLLRLTKPAFTGIPRVVKGMFDRLGAAVLLLLIAPVMTVLAIAVRSDGGPVFYRQCRIGKHGTPFLVIKFRSMILGADQWRCELTECNQASGPLFKLREDPSVVTRVWL